MLVASRSADETMRDASRYHEGISFPQSTSVPNHVYRPKMTAGTSGSAPLILPFMSNSYISSGIHATATKQFMPCSHVQMDFMRRISGVDLHRNLNQRHLVSSIYTPRRRLVYIAPLC